MSTVEKKENKPSHMQSLDVEATDQAKESHQKNKVEEALNENENNHDTNPNSNDGPPDGGLEAWTVVLGGFLTLFCSFGFLNNFPAFQNYYHLYTLRNYSDSAISWIGAMQAFAILSANLVIGPIFDRYGPRPCLIFATLAFSFGCMMTSISTKYYQIFLSQGVVVGWSLGAAFITPLACVMQWFDKNRPAALGIAISGSSIGGVVWPIVTIQLLNRLHFAWCWRILGFLGLGLLPITVLTVKMPPHVIKAKKERGPQPILSLAAFKVPKYWMFTISYCTFVLGLFPLIFYFPQLTKRYGVNSDLQFYSISILNAFSFIGRLGLPILAQKTGVYGTTIVCIFACAIVAFACMAIDSAVGSLVAAGAFGFTSGGALSLVLGCIHPVLVNVEALGAEVGQIFFVGSFFGLVSGPIAGWILTTNPEGEWIGVEGFVGATLIVSTISLVIVRHRLNSNWKEAF